MTLIHENRAWQAWPGADFVIGAMSHARSAQIP
jgi:hypothetical protein